METKNSRSKNLAVRSGNNLSQEIDALKTTHEAAEFLKISEAHLRLLTNKGQIPHFKFGRQNRYRLKDLFNLIKPANQRG